MVVWWCSSAVQQCSSSKPSSLHTLRPPTPTHPHTSHLTPSLTLSRRKRRSVVASTHSTSNPGKERGDVQVAGSKTSTVVARVHSPQSTVLIPDDARVPAVPGVPARIKYLCWLYVWKTSNQHMVYAAARMLLATRKNKNTSDNEMAMPFTQFILVID